MTDVVAIEGIVAALVGAFGGAWYGGRLQRSSNTETLALQLQIDAAAKFLGAVGDAAVAYGHANKPGAEDLSLTERDEPGYAAFVGLKALASAVAIVGPDALADIADQLLAQALVADFDHGTEGLAAQLEVGRLAEQFENEARKLLRPTSRQKNGRSSTDSAPKK
jgi:hypothetical protein